MNYIKLTVLDTGKILLDKTLILYAVDYTGYTLITLSDGGVFQIVESVDVIANILKENI